MSEVEIRSRVQVEWKRMRGVILGLGRSREVSYVLHTIRSSILAPHHGRRLHRIVCVSNTAKCRPALTLVQALLQLS